LALRRRQNRAIVSLPTGSAVVVSGASRGLGRATALHLCNVCGLKVFAGVRRPEDGTNIVQRADVSNGGEIIPLQLDITNSDQCRAAAQLVDATDGIDKIHAIICCAGIGVLGPMETVDVDKLRLVMDVQVFGTVRLLQAFGPLLRAASDPRIVLCSSPVERMAIPLMGANVLSRHATAGLARLAEIETSGWPVPIKSIIVWPLGVTSGQSEVQFPQLKELSDISAMAKPEDPLSAYASVIQAVWGMWSKMGFKEGKCDEKRQSAILPEDVAPVMANAVLLQSPPRLLVAGRGGPIPFISSLPTSLQIFGMRKRLGLS